jgi:long-chain acyl-CoA synthetase
MGTLTSSWEEIEKKKGNHLALVFANERMTYAETGARIRRLSAALQARWQVKKGEVVALIAPNCPEFVISYFAIVRIGAIVQPIDERLTPEEMRDILLDSGARFLIVHASLWGKFEKIRERISTECVLGIKTDVDGIARLDDWISPAGSLHRESDNHPEDIAELMYTSGTTGTAKAVMRSHTNILAASRNARIAFGYSDHDIIAVVMPMSHSSALTSQMLPMIEKGGTLVLVDRFDVNDLIRLIQSERITCLRAVPSMMRMLLVSSRFCAGELPSLRLLINSSAAIDPETFTEIKGRFSEIQVLNSYGLTEASTCTILQDGKVLTRPDSVGVPIEGVEMCVMDEEGRDVPDGEEGEICIQGPHVFRGYRNREEETRAVFSGAWLRTGDLGRRDPEGFYYLHGRKKDVINCGGRKFAPLEVENCILQLPEIADVAVVGISHRMLGQVAKAFVVLKSGERGDTKRITQHCSRILASHKVPFFVEVVSALPKNGVGKVLHRKLQEQGQSR